MIGRAMGGRNPARYLAPLAIAATIAGTYLIVHSRLSVKPAAVSHVAITQPTAPSGKYAKAHFYTVQSGDDLSKISAKTGVPVPTLEALNPTANPNLLRAGQRLRLRR